MTFSVARNPQPASDADREAVLAAPGFGKHFTDHMVRIDWTVDGGWDEGRVLPYGPISLEPASAVLHYGQEIFEGLKAYRQVDGSVAAFRPEANAERMQRSARRMAMAELPTELFVESLRALVGIDEQWVPQPVDQSLYLRPFMIATQDGLGVNAPSSSFAYLLIASPAGDYFSGGVRPVTVWLSTEYTRAAPGGTGEVKCGGNYAASFAATAEAAAHGCDQVVWLDAFEHRWVEEMGSNNLGFVFGSGPGARIVTPALTGTLLPGITRTSLLEVATELGYTAEEGKISVEEWRDGCASGAITEVFGCGTAAVVTPIGAVRSADGEFTIGDGPAGAGGPVTAALRERLVGIQTGRVEDTHGWMTRLN
ncbi:branched-chain amino acid aminotransferase [Jatrophihabitans endophyticus]|uniref:branched-chain-amino-acid transaminase n=1 Tax=Jatrophihabitans endophyticus TaxID=1206085 RepID=A0A1M5HSN9_9ACTN|nr:branched-chain amino acid aminotransferase [Jatrophihabitans endophyticus]SHG18989.1 branched-chain amino acid aminotransferase [Jatrophihabitans endophyticus]